MISLAVEGAEAVIAIDSPEPIEYFKTISEITMNSLVEDSMSSKLFILVGQALFNEVTSQKYRDILSEADYTHAVIPMIVKGQEDITKQLSESASKESMSSMMNATIKLVRMLKYIPLFVKRPAARIVYGFLGDKVFSNTLSNLGIVKIPLRFCMILWMKQTN